jgi:hypothetical protein
VAKEMITKCDDCGKAGSDVETVTIRIDGLVIEVDLDKKHQATVTITRAREIGRVLENGIRRGNSTASLTRRVRGAPES